MNQQTKACVAVTTAIILIFTAVFAFADQTYRVFFVSYDGEDLVVQLEEWPGVPYSPTGPWFVEFSRDSETWPLDPFVDDSQIAGPWQPAPGTELHMTDLGSPGDGDVDTITVAEGHIDDHL